MSAQRPLSIIVVGGSGDLARRKIYPALFALYSQGLLPPRFHIIGFSRTRMSDEEFRARVTEHLTCRYLPQQSCEERMGEFLARCFYVAGQYESPESFLDVYSRLREVEGAPESNRIFYLAVPPAIFTASAQGLGGAGMVSCDPCRPWSRVVIEKPFGRDRESSDELTREMAKVFTEDQTYRIDHYLGKEVIQNLLVLRFANLIFEPIWNRDFVESIRISWKEDIGIEGRGGYFESYGVIRDVVQNHLVQMLALVAMEPPPVLDAGWIRDEKVKVLRCVAPVRMEDVVLGQYAAAEREGLRLPAYRDDPTVAPDSRTPTFAAVALRVNNRRWDGVPVFLRAGKALNGRETEIRIRFRRVPGNMFAGVAGSMEPNELVIRVQPDESIQFRIMNKVPGLRLELQARNLDLRYKAAFEEIIPDAYENLLLDVIGGEKSLFIRGDELAAAWDIFTPALHEIDRRGVQPEYYPFGSQGPAGAAALAERLGLPSE